MAHVAVGHSCSQVIPIYGRGACTTDPRTKSTKVVEDEVPRRPAGQRPVPVQRHPVLPGQPPFGSQGLGFVPTLFGLQPSPGQGGYAEPLTPEQQHQAFLSRLLLMLGSFVIMCLLLVRVLGCFMIMPTPPHISQF